MSRFGRIATVLLRWPVGIALVSWRYMWRTTVLRRTNVDGGPDDFPPRLPDAVVDGAVQDEGDGVGPLLRRLFQVRIRGTRWGPDELMAVLTADLNRAVPSEVAFFRRLHGAEGPPQVGDEYVVRMPGPWDGPVRVVSTGPASLRFATLRGHLEAGQIEFRARTSDGTLLFEIEAWARAGDRLAALLYHRLRLAKEIQLNMWTHFCLRACAIADGRPDGGVTIATRRARP